MALIAADAWMMAVLDAVRRVDPPDGWIGAGFVRRKVWDDLHGYARPSRLADIDVLYYCAGDLSRTPERQIEGRLRAIMPGRPWSAKNQARMHLRNGDRPYASTIDAMRYWLETPTCIAVRLTAAGGLELAAPYGLEDLLNLTVRPTPAGQRRGQAYRDRLESKNWRRIWPRTQVIWPSGGAGPQSELGAKYTEIIHKWP